MMLSRPIINVETAMMIKVLTESRQVLHGATYRPLASDELVDKEEEEI